MAKKSKNKDIAIIGLSVKFPGAQSLNGFWDLLISGKQASNVIPEKRRQDMIDYLSYMQRNYLPIKNSGFMTIEGVDEFDYDFFNFSPKDAKLTDPNQRKFLETAWSAIEDAGYMGSRIKNSNTGVYVGASSDFNNYARVINDLFPDDVKNISPAVVEPYIASRISYVLNLKGPNMIIDTACSSALVALFKACQDLRNNQYEIAIVGGVNIYTLHDNLGRRSEIISPEYKTKPFDDSSLGTNWGEGVAALVLKPLNKAMRDKDNVHAIIKGGAINQDGRSSSLTSPNPEAQAEVIEKAWQDAGIKPETISYIETHGTGTPTGDPIEIDGISRAFKKHTKKKQFCAIGSVKSNIGHLNSASGMAGIVKNILSLKNKKIPASINFDFPNKKIDFINSPVYVNDKLTDWSCEYSPLRCGVSSSGFSGTNCHIILEEAQKSNLLVKKEFKDILTISARNENALNRLIKKYLSFIKENRKLNLNNLCYTANTGREHFEYRLAIIVDNLRDLEERLEVFLKHNKGNNLYYGKIRDKKNVFDKNKINYENLINIAKNYVLGHNPEWGDLYKTKRQKISLPTYSFEKTRCWFKIDKDIRKKIKKLKNQSFYPFFYTNYIESLENDFYQIFLNSSDDWILREHIVGGNFMLVGTAYIEIVTEICVEKFGFGRFILNNLKHLQPMVFFKNETKEIQVIFQKNKKIITIMSRFSNDSGWIENFKCSFEDFNYSKKFDEKINLSKIVNSFFRESTSKTSNVYDHEALNYGKRWDLVKMIYYKENNKFIKNESLTEIFINEENREESSNYVLYPPAFDRVVFCDIANKFLGNDFLYLPNSYRKLIINKKLSSNFFVHLFNTRQEEENKFLICDANIIDKDGSLIASVKGCEAERSNSLNKKRTNKFEKKKNKPFFSVKWKEIIKNEKSSAKLNMNGITLIFKKDRKIINKIVDNLSVDRKVEIKISNSYKKINENEYIIRNKQADFNKLLENFKKEKIDKIVHLLTLEGKKEVSTYKELKDSQELGSFSLFRIIKALQNNNLNKQKIEIVLISSFVFEVDGTEKRINPENAPLFGLGKAVTAEENKLKCYAIDIDRNTDVNKIVDRIKNNPNSYNRAFRNNKEYYEYLEKEDILKIKDSKFILKKKGNYIITGGAGGLGLEVAQYFSSIKNINLFFLNRSSLPPKNNWDEIIKKNTDPKLIHKLKSIKEIEKRGSRVICCKVDVSNSEQIDKLFIKIRKKFSGINGIVHCAGLAGGGILENKSEEDFKKHYKTKVFGTWILNQKTLVDKLDFFISFSSVISIFGIIGQSDYGSASSYLDSFVCYGARKGLPIINLIWDGWKEVGMAFEHNSQNKTEVKKIFIFLKTNKAINYLEAILNKKINNIVITDLNYDNFPEPMRQYLLPFSGEVIRLFSSEKKENLKNKKEDIKLIDNDFKNYEIKNKIAQIWGDILGYPEINSNSSFFDLGGDSLSAIQSLTAINKKFNLNFVLPDLSEKFSIALLAEEINKRLVKRINNKKEKKSIKGGVPLTIIGDYLDENNLNKINFDTICFQTTKGFNLDLFNLSLKKINTIIPQIKLGILIKEKDKYKKIYYGSKNLKSTLDDYIFGINKEVSVNKEIKKKEEILQSYTVDKEVNILLIKFKKNNLKIIFCRDKQELNDNKFTNYLISFQRVYNLLLAGFKIKSEAEINSHYTPFRSFPSYYSCSHSHLLEKIYWETGRMLSKNIFLLFDFSGLPNYFLVDRYRRKTSVINHEILNYDYNNLFSYKTQQGKGKEEALARLKNLSKLNKVVLLGGLIYFIPNYYLYRDEKFLEYIEKNLFVDRNNLANIQGDFNRGLVIHSSVSNYFGQIDRQDFIDFWTNSKIPNKVNKLKKINDNSFTSYQIKYSKIFFNEFKYKNLFFKKLKENVKEYFESRIIKGGDGFKEVYFGRSALKIFKKEITKSLNQDKIISDLTIVDIIEKLIINYLCFHNILMEASHYDNEYIKGVQGLAEIINLLKINSSDMKKNLNEKKINNMFASHLYPDIYSFDFKLLRPNMKGNLIRDINHIINIQEKVFIFLANKLKLNI